MIFDLKNIIDIFGNIAGIIHIGAFRGEEIKQYREIGLKNTILFEPQEHLYHMFKYQLLPTEQAYNFALGDEEGELDLYISKTDGGIQNGSGASSSFLKPKIHLTEHPNVIFDGTIEKCKIKRLDNVVLENNINIQIFTLLSNKKRMNFKFSCYDSSLTWRRNVGYWLMCCEMIGGGGKWFGYLTMSKTEWNGMNISWKVSWVMAS